MIAGLHRTPRSLTGGADAGAISVFFAVGMVAVAMIIALSVDGTGEMSAQQRANSYAGEAARAAGQTVDIQEAISGVPTVLDETRAVNAVNHYLDVVNAQDGVTFDSSKLQVSIDNSAHTVTVTLGIVYTQSMLGLFTIGQSQTVTEVGRATAVLVVQ